ncbi:hypothetical protein KUTeg_019807 [Tegillarca granosa]|uniref:Transglutaminase N-terminal domain-containing protein n=1 Tax=Tegillarca granosa TaxID=220873 RepID=A0ABQ9EDI5_TEGGR|nr:hypothetical protein KUTeg_019807 [Tegillarca granosa]
MSNFKADRTRGGFNVREVGKHDESDPNSLKVVNVNLNVSRNSKPHHTDKFYEDEEFKGCVLRRGQPFDIDITFNKPYNQKEDELKLIFEYVFAMRRVRVTLILSDEDVPGEWGAKLLSNRDITIVVRVYTPATLYIGEWKFMIDVLKKVDNIKVGYRFRHEQKMFIIFNPWCKDDLVYLPKENDVSKPNEELLVEYVLNDTGKVFKSAGIDNKVYPPKPIPNGKTWNFAQFDHPVLECVVEVLYKHYLALTDRADPVKISRKLSSLCVEHWGFQQRVVGKLIMTQKPQHMKKNIFDDQQDVTHDYKYKEAIAFEMAVTFNEYREKLTDQCCTKETCAFRIMETDQVYSGDLEVALEKPALTISAPDKAKVGIEFPIELSFVNPLPEKLTGCFVKVEGLKDIVQVEQGLDRDENGRYS